MKKQVAMIGAWILTAALCVGCSSNQTAQQSTEPSQNDQQMMSMHCMSTAFRAQVSGGMSMVCGVMVGHTVLET